MPPLTPPAATSRSAPECLECPPRRAVTHPTHQAGQGERPGRVFYCSHCDQHKPLSEFWRLSPDGTRPSGRCRACQSIATSKSARRDGYRKAARRVKRWRHRHPEKARAVARDGKRAQRKGTRGRCVDCGRRAMHIHHDDYSKPGVPLCFKCHLKRHGKRCHTT